MKSSTYAMIAAAFLSAAPAAAAEEEWRDTADGVLHLSTGITCPKSAGKLVLGASTAHDRGFTCQYDYVCKAPADCEAELAQASVVWDNSPNYYQDFVAEIKNQGLLLYTSKPVLGGLEAQAYAAATVEGHAAAMGYWTVPTGSVDVNVGGLYSEPAKPSVVALIEETKRLNPAAQ